MRLRQRQRLTLVLAALLLLGGATTLVMLALSDSVAFFATPTDVATGQVEGDKRFRIGGLVVAGSIQRDPADGLIRFALSDEVHAVTVAYRGILPDLFREGQGIVAQGTLGADGTFLASEVLAKHDENYMPPEVSEALRRAGMWQHAGPGSEGGGAEP